MTISPELIAAGSGIVTAIVGGVIAFIVSVLSKEQKTSEFRQAWIDALRNEMANYFAKNIAFTEAVTIYRSRENAGKELSDFILDRFAEVHGIETARAKILLRLNPDEHQKLINLVNNVYGRSGVATQDFYTSGLERTEALLSESQQLLKSEWKRVKTGEPIFYWTKWLSLGLAIISLIVVLSFFYGRIHIGYAP